MTHQLCHLNFSKQSIIYRLALQVALCYTFSQFTRKTSNSCRFSQSFNQAHSAAAIGIPRSLSLSRRQLHSSTENNWSRIAADRRTPILVEPKKPLSNHQLAGQCGSSFSTKECIVSSF
uniref:(northern house mosquito) hypothetical protein n=1 Tax=Culex pipiens TaxID=7175 RepID=A0A8D8CA44_CULPI